MFVMLSTKEDDISFMCVVFSTAEDGSEKFNSLYL